MGEKLGTGIYVSEFPQKPHIVGVPTSIAGFVGPAHSGPMGVSSAAVGDMAQFECTYGSGEPIETNDGSRLNYLWYAARAFFREGGKRLYISRVEVGDEAQGLKALEEVEEISIVAAPGEAGEAAWRSLIQHAEGLRHRVAVLDTGLHQSPEQVLTLRASVDSSNAAIYYPWIKAADDISGGEILLPPSGFVAGIYARNDLERGVSKAPANLPLNSAVGVERDIAKPLLEDLNLQGVNTIRTFGGRSVRVWGARTAGSSSEWKYVNIRRYLAYLERSIDLGTQWVVFEPNGERLWNEVRRTIEDFLHKEWTTGALLGNKPEQAFFVKCDRSTMTQDDLDNGRLVCLIGVATVRPAEFVIFRIGQWTADSTRESE